MMLSTPSKLNGHTFFMLEPAGYLHHVWEILGGILLVVNISLFLGHAYALSYIAYECDNDDACMPGDEKNMYSVVAQHENDKSCHLGHR